MNQDNLCNCDIGAQSGRENAVQRQSLGVMWRNFWRAMVIGALMLVTGMPAASAAVYPDNLVQIRVWDTDGNYVTYDALFIAIELYDCGTGAPLSQYEVRAPDGAIMLLHMADGTIPDVRVRYVQRNYNTNYLGKGLDVMHVFVAGDEQKLRSGFEPEKCLRHWR